MLTRLLPAHQPSLLLPLATAALKGAGLRPHSYSALRAAAVALGALREHWTEACGDKAAVTALLSLRQLQVGRVNGGTGVRFRQ